MAERILAGLVCVLIAITAYGYSFRPDGAESRPIPRAAHKYRGLAVRLYRVHFGLNAPIPILAAQIEQESAWRKDAKSHAGAEGLGQFMPATARQMGDWYKSLEPANARSPRWALDAQARYMKRLFGNFRMKRAASMCDRWAFTLSAYNGGLGNLSKDMSKGIEEGRDKTRWYGHDGIARVRTRSVSAQRENREYPNRIFEKRWKYRKWGGSRLACAPPEVPRGMPS